MCIENVVVRVNGLCICTTLYQYKVFYANIVCISNRRWRLVCLLIVINFSRSRLRPYSRSRSSARDCIKNLDLFEFTLYLSKGLWKIVIRNAKNIWRSWFRHNRVWGCIQICPIVQIYLYECDAPMTNNWGETKQYIFIVAMRLPSTLKGFFWTR